MYCGSCCVTLKPAEVPNNWLHYFRFEKPQVMYTYGLRGRFCVYVRRGGAISCVFSRDLSSHGG